MEKVRTYLSADLAVNASTLAVALVIAEQLYRFHSFTLEALAFLATWWSLRQVGLFLTRR